MEVAPINAENQKELYTALIEFQKNSPTIAHSRTVDAGRMKYSYAEFSVIREAIRRPLADAGLGFMQIIEGEKLITRIIHVSGQSIEGWMTLKLDGLSPQQVGSAISYAKRYSISAILGISTHEDDDAQFAEMVTKLNSPNGEAQYTVQAPTPKGMQPERVDFWISEFHKAKTQAYLKDQWQLASTEATALSDTDAHKKLRAIVIDRSGILKNAEGAK